MASVATQYATHAIYTSDNPRSEDPAAILDDMVHGANGDNYEVIIDRKEAIHHASLKRKQMISLLLLVRVMKHIKLLVKMFIILTIVKSLKKQLQSV